MSHQYLFFLNPSEIHNNSYTLRDEEFRHCCKVLRKKEQEQINLTDGKGNIFKAVILEIGRRYAKIQIRESIRSNEFILPINLGIGIIKGQKFDFLARKLVELGVHSITPLIMDYSVRERIDIERLKRIMISAMKQSGGSYLPYLSHEMTLEEFLTNISADTLKIIAEQNGQLNLSNLLTESPDRSIICVIGPEGGFSKKESNLLKENDFQSISLNPRRLMTETAAISMVCSLYALAQKKREV